MPVIAHLNDQLTQGGRVIQASPDVMADSRAVARVGDMALCLRHGLVRIVSGASTVFANGRAVAYHGSLCSCGARLICSGTVMVEE